MPIFFPALKAMAPRWRVVLFLIVFSGATTAARAAGPDPVFQKSVAHFQDKNYAASRDLLKKLVKKSPKNGLYWFNLGNAHFMLESFKQAEDCFTKVEKLRSPLAPAARLYRAKALRAQGLHARAIETLQTLADTADLPAAVKEAAERERIELLAENELRRKNSALDHYRAEEFDQALREIEALKQPDDDGMLLKGLILLALDRTAEANAILTGLRWKPASDLERKDILRDLTDRIRREIEPTQTFWGLAETLAGANSNVFLDSGSDARAAAIVKAAGTAGIRPWRQGPWSASAQARIEWDETLGIGDLKVLSNTAQASLHYDTFSSQTQLSGACQYDVWANEPVLLEAGLRGRNRQYWNGYEITFDFGFARTVPQDSDIGYLGGTIWDARLSAGRTIYPVYMELGLGIQRQGIGDQTFADGSVLPWGFQGWGPALRLIWKASDLWFVSAQANIRQRDYFKATAPDNHHRADRETGFTSTLTRILGPRLSTYFSVALVNNASTLGSSDVRNENYSVQTAFIGMLYDVR